MTQYQKNDESNQPQQGDERGETTAMYGELETQSWHISKCTCPSNPPDEGRFGGQGALKPAAMEHN
jgi:hypothetical protein